MRRAVSKMVGAITDVDSARITRGNTIMEFSWPVRHGEAGTRLGFVLMARVRYEDECFIYAPDVQGPVVRDCLAFFTEIPCDMAFVGGPPLYLKDSLKTFPFDDAVAIAAELHGLIPRLIYDHHCCRSEDDFDRFIGQVRASGVDVPSRHELGSAASFMGAPRRFLESHRDDLYLQSPPDEPFTAWSALPKARRTLVSPPLA